MSTTNNDLERDPKSATHTSHHLLVITNDLSFFLPGQAVVVSTVLRYIPCPLEEMSY